MSATELIATPVQRTTESKITKNADLRGQKKSEPKTLVVDGVPVMPDEPAFKRANQDIERKLSLVQMKLDKIFKKKKIAEVRQSNDSNDGISRIREEMNAIKKEQAVLKEEKTEVLKKIKALENSSKEKQQLLHEKQKSLAFRNVEAVDAYIAKLLRAVDSATMKINEERKTLNEIAMLKKSKKAYAEISAIQSEIKDYQNLLTKTREQLRDPRADALNTKMRGLIDQMNELRFESDKTYTSLKSTLTERDKFLSERESLFKTKKELGDTFYGQLKAFRAYEKKQKQLEIQRRKERYEKEKLRREEEEKQKKELKRKQAAQKMLEEAEKPAFLRQIQTCKNLLRIFDPFWSAQNLLESEKEKKPLIETEFQSSNAPRTLQPRKVEAQLTGSVIKKKDDVNYMPSLNKTKKSKKSSKTEVSNKLQLNFSVLQDLQELEIEPPTSKENTAKTVDLVKAKLKFFEDNQAEETAKRVEAAKEEIAKLEKAEEEANQVVTEESAQD